MGHIGTHSSTLWRPGCSPQPLKQMGCLPRAPPCPTRACDIHLNQLTKKIRANSIRKHTACGFSYLVRFSCPPTSTHQIYTTKLVLHQQITDETSANQTTDETSPIENQTSSDLVTVIGSAYMLISKLDA